MKSLKLKYKILGATALLLLLFFFFLSTFVRKWIVNHSAEIIGRKIALKELHFNYLKAAVKARGFVMFEINRADTFVSFRELYVDFNPWALIRRTYSFSRISLVDPYVYVSQDGDRFNFDDLLPQGDTASAEEQDTTLASPLYYSFRNIQVKGGCMVYEDRLMKNHLDVRDLNLDVPLISWDSRQSNAGLQFRLGDRGEVDIGIRLNNRDRIYSVDLHTKTISVEPALDYLKNVLDITKLRGFLSTELTINGDLEHIMEFSVAGKVSVDSLLLHDGHDDKLLSIDRLVANISNLDLDASRYHLSSVVVTHPDIVATLDRDRSNWERVLSPLLISDTVTSPADTVRTDSTAQTDVAYRLDSLVIMNGNLGFTDKTLNRPFSFQLGEMFLSLTGLSESAPAVPVVFSMNTNKEGSISGDMMLDMVNTLNLSCRMKIDRLGLLSFSPYSEYYIASPVTRGWLSYDFSIQMTPERLVNENKVHIEKLELGKRTADTTAVRVPVKLALYILKDLKENIDFELPVEGNPSEPRFSYGKILWKALGNFFVKTAAAPINVLGRTFGSGQEDLEKIPFEYSQVMLEEKQTDLLTDIALVMKNKPGLIFSFVQYTDPAKEKEHLAVYLAKRAYVISFTGMKDSLGIATKVNELSTSDKGFAGYIQTRVPHADSLDLGLACTRLFTPAELETQLTWLLAGRNEAIKEFLAVSQGISPETMEISTGDLTNVPVELRYPHFSVEVTVR